MTHTTKHTPGPLKAVQIIIGNSPCTWAVQRGCALYILSAEVLEQYKDMPVDSIYSNGIAVY